MPNAMTWMIGGFVYFALVAIVVMALGYAGMTDNMASGGFDTSSKPSLGINKTGFLSSVTGTFSIAQAFKLIFSFFAFDIADLSAVIGVQLLIILRIVFVYIPFALIVIAGLYSLPTMGGGG
jgi:hypothetical protein